VVELSAEPLVQSRLARIEAFALDDRYAPGGDVKSFATDADGWPFSFGALADQNHLLRLMVRGFDAADASVIEYPVQTSLSTGEKTRMRVLLRDACLNVTCAAALRCELAAGALQTSCAPIDSAPNAGCGARDGTCPDACSWRLDDDCPRDNGVACSTSDQCSSSHCVRGVCCNEACDDACHSCALNSEPGVCVAVTPLPSVEHCGGCDMKCSAAHISPHCSSALRCDGECAPNYADCNDDKLTDGCEADLLQQPDHCGSCSNVCPYGVCDLGTCIFGGAGTWMGTKEVQWPANRIFGVRVPIIEDALVAGLGIKLGHGVGYSQGTFRMGLYRDQDGSPSTRIDHVGPTSTLALDTHDPGVFSVYQGFERRLSQPVPVHAGDRIWLFAVANTELYVLSEPYQQTILSRAQAFDDLVEMPPSFTLGSLESSPPTALPDLYVVTIPSP
jgi:hypothetical protein